jgi:NADPH:quinone reductase-like Zn-dependent oxidoreductase
VLGRDVSGVVEACGTETNGHQKGDEIYAMLGIDRGAYAEDVIVKANEAAPKPRSIDHLAAAGVPLAGLTVVGHVAIQFAKAKGAHVIPTVSEKHIEFVREIGADDVVDYKKRKFEDVVRELDVVFDLIGGETRKRSWPVLKKGGILVSTMMEPFQGEHSRTRRARCAFYRSGERGRASRDW